MVAAGMLTSIADALHLNHPLADPESQGCGLMLNQIYQRWGFDSPRHTALVANEVDIRRGRHCLDLRKKRISALDPRYQAAFEQNSQASVDTCWQHSSPRRHLELRDDAIGAKRSAGADQDVQNHLAQGRQLASGGP
jgi:hypothetical protein